jgi:hypothetical protein
MFYIYFGSPIRGITETEGFNSVLRGIFGLKREEVTGGWR